MKTCRTCKIEKDFDQYTTHSRSEKTLRLDCNKCRSTAWTNGNKDPNKREHRKQLSKNAKLKQTYGITIEEYNKLFEKQKGCCAICDKHQSEFKKSLFVDHNHETMKVRELLCSNCNFAVGQFKENIEFMKKAIQYLEKHNSELKLVVSNGK